MTGAVLASGFLAGSLLAMLVPMATLIALVTWGVVLIRRRERQRADTDTGDGPAAPATAPEGSQSAAG